MTIKQYIKEKGWQIECETNICRAMDVDVNFVTDEGMDEVQFSIPPYGERELNELFTKFCKENNFPRNTVTCISIVKMRR